MTQPVGWRRAAFNQGWVYRTRIGVHGSGEWLSACMARRYRHSSLSVWLARIERGELSLNEATIAEDIELKKGDRISWRRPPWLEAEIPDRWETIHDDGDLLVINKPSGLPVVPGGGFLRHTLAALLEPTGARPVHRLGRFTSGLQVCARRPETRAALSRQFRPGGGCRKLYRAWAHRVGGLMPGRMMKIESDVVERLHPLTGWIWGPDPQMPDLPVRRRRPASSRLRLLKRCTQGDLVEVMITTGRPHQIRIHLAQIGSPLLGDPLYRADRTVDPLTTPGDGGYLLHASSLEISQGCFHCPERFPVPDL